MKEFKNKVALITGAGNGFGFEFTKEAVRRGMKLMLADIDAADLERTKQWVLEQGEPWKRKWRTCLWKKMQIVSYAAPWRPTDRSIF